MSNNDPHVKRMLSSASRVTVDQYFASVTPQREADESIPKLLPGNGHILLRDSGILDGDCKQEEIVVRSAERSLAEDDARRIGVEASLFPLRQVLVHDSGYGFIRECVLIHV
jgi:hypothetical protein